MKKLFIAAAMLILLFTSCEKEGESTCATCTVTITTVSDDPTSGYKNTQTKVYEQITTEGSCELSLSQYESLITAQAESEIANSNALNPQTSYNPVSGSFYEFNITTTLNSIVCAEN